MAAAGAKRCKVALEDWVVAAEQAMDTLLPAAAAAAE